MSPESQRATGLNYPRENRSSLGIVKPMRCLARYSQINGAIFQEGKVFCVTMAEGDIGFFRHLFYLFDHASTSIKCSDFPKMRPQLRSDEAMATSSIL